MPKLIATNENSGAVTHEFDAALVTIGRGPENMIRLDDPSVSSRHAELRSIGEGYRLTDLESTNGTFLNGRAVTSAHLRIGDRLSFGKVVCRLESDAPEATRPLPELQTAKAELADASIRPADFANASPFPNRKNEKDVERRTIFAGALLAVVTFVASMFALLLMRGPASP